jgi:hypothetical protein
MYILKYKLNKLKINLTLYRIININIDECWLYFLHSYHIFNYYRKAQLIRSRGEVPLLYKEYVLSIIKPVLETVIESICILIQGIILEHLTQIENREILSLILLNLIPVVSIIIVIFMHNIKYNGCKLKKPKRYKNKRHFIPVNVYI